MVNGNRPPARIENDRSLDGKLKSHLEWPYGTIIQTEISVLFFIILL